MASLMRSAAVPWTGALIAWRSALPRSWALAAWSPSMRRIRPNRVDTRPVARACTLIPSRYSRTRGSRAK